MEFLRRVFAEATLVAPRLSRTRFGSLLVLLGLALIWLRSHGVEARTAVLEAGALGAVLGAVWLAGNARDRAALATALTHPTTPLAIAIGRWSAIVGPAAVLTVACAVATREPAPTIAAGLAASAAVGAVALATVLLVGNGAAVVLFLFIATAGAVAPERLVGLAHPGIIRLAAASVLELGPALWHYREIGTGDWPSAVHAVAWVGLGILLSSAVINRQRTALH